MLIDMFFPRTFFQIMTNWDYDLNSFMRKYFELNILNWNSEFL